MATRIKTIELFLALGFATAVGTQVVPANAHESEETMETPALADYALIAQSHGHEMAQEGEGGGESTEGAVGTGNPDVDYMTVLGLMKGHLNAAQELIAAKNYEEAEPHIGHPIEELYADIETVLPQKGVKDFKPTLNQLHDLIISAPESPEVQTLLDESLASIDGAIAVIPKEQINSPEFVLDVMVEMLKNAAAEYEAAIANNQFVEIVEYQDSKGFVYYADELYQTVAAQKSKVDPEGHKTITDSLAELKTAWPSIEPPTTPIKQPGEIQALVSQIEFSK
jgi:hypothetical protein